MLPQSELPSGAHPRGTALNRYRLTGPFSTTSIFLTVLLVLAIAGCSTDPSRERAHISNWQERPATRMPAPAAAVLPPEPILAPPPSNPPVRPAIPEPAVVETWVPLQRWARDAGLAAPGRLTQGVPPSYALRSAWGTFVLHVGSQSAQWNGLELRLGFAPQMINSRPYVHGLDLQKTLQPLLTGATDCAWPSNPVVVLDPGHGGSDVGTRSVVDGRYEKEFTLDWALRLKALLAASGWRVFLSRSSDTDLALSNRVACADEHKAGLFLSLHFNSAAPNQTESGLETYCLTPAGMPSSLTRGYADDTAATFPNNLFDAQNLQLALRVHQALLQVNGNHDRGVRRARFPAVLRWQQRPAILVEGGYLSNPYEARLIAEPAYRQKLAQAIADVLTGPGPGHSPQALARVSEETNAESKVQVAESKVQPARSFSEGASPKPKGNDPRSSTNFAHHVNPPSSPSDVQNSEALSHYPEIP